MPDYILSIETSTTVCSVALHDKAMLLATLEHHGTNVHSQSLPAMVEYLWRLTNLDKQALQAVAVSQGPGSYTGLRVGISYAKGICYGRSIPLIAINTLQVLAAAATSYPLDEGGLLYPLLDARYGNAYGMVLQDQNIICSTHTCNVSSAIAERWPNQAIYFMGSGAENYQEKLKSIPHTSMIRGLYPAAKHMGYVGWQAFCGGSFAEVATLNPIYLSAFTAAKKSGR